MVNSETYIDPAWLHQQTQVILPRFIAFAIDILILSLVLNITASTDVSSFMGIGGPIIPIALFHNSYSELSIHLSWGVIIMTFYYTLCEWLFGGTPGKLICYLRVISMNGKRITFRQSLIRNILRPIDISLLIGFIMISSTKAHQRLGDEFANTIVTETKYLLAPLYTSGERRQRQYIFTAIVVIYAVVSIPLARYLKPSTNDIYQVLPTTSCAQGWTYGQGVWSNASDGTPIITYAITYNSSSANGQTSSQQIRITQRWHGFFNGGWKFDPVPVIHCSA